MKTLTDEIRELIDTGREDDWWDFKECHHEDKVTLLHDIICLANNRADRDAYLIFGIQDKTFNVMGVEDDPNRRNQQNIVDFLRSKSFTGQTRPRVEVRTVLLDAHEIDVFIVKNSTDVPYYLIEDYSEKITQKSGTGKSKTVHANYIYTRVMDNNTPINQSADLRDVEYLWKKRFGLTQTALDQAKVLLKSADEWVFGGTEYYHSIFSQFRIVEEYHHDNNGEFLSGVFEYYHGLYKNNAYTHGNVIVSHYSTQIYSCMFEVLGSFVLLAPSPSVDEMILTVDNVSFLPRYYLKTELYYQIFFYFIECFRKDLGDVVDEYAKTFLDVILVFENRREESEFMEFLKQNLDILHDLVSKEPIPELLDLRDNDEEQVQKRIQIARALKKMQIMWLEN